MNVNVCLDVGGTFIKGLVFDESGKELIDGVNYYESLSTRKKEIIVDNFIYIISDLFQQVINQEKQLSAINIAFPGPFDYQTGISYIKNLNKYDSLYQINLKELINQKIQVLPIKLHPKITIHFFNDALSFAFGEYYSDKPSNGRGAYITLGTGCGSTFIEKGKVVRGKYNIPDSGMIYKEPIEKTIIDDYLSARGLERIIYQIYGSYIEPEIIYKKALSKDKKARTVFHLFGQLLGKGLSPYLVKFSPAHLVFGGQVSKSFTFMEQSFRDRLDRMNQEMKISVSSNTSLSTIKGLNYLKNQEENQLYI